MQDSVKKFEKEILKLGRYSRCFVTFCKQRQRNEQSIITYAYTAIVLLAVAGKAFLIKLLITK